MLWIDRFRRDERGSASIEFVLWIPILIPVLLLTIDATTLYQIHSEMWNVARDTARQLSDGDIMCPADAKTYAIDALSHGDPQYAADHYFVQAWNDSVKGAQVVITLRMKDTPIFGWAALTLMGRDIVARVVMRYDPRLKPTC